MDNSTFASKFLSRIQRIDTPQIETFLANLLREKDFQRVILDSLPDGILMVDDQQRLEYGNDSARALLGIRTKNPSGQPLRKLLRSKVLQNLAEEFEENGRPIAERELRLRTPATRVYSVSIMPIEDRDGHLTHALWLISDRTSTVRRAAERHQIENMRSMATLTAGIAHEIKNPLNSLNIHAQMVGKAVAALQARGFEEPELPRLAASAGVFREEIARLTGIVDQFIKAVRPAAPAFQPASLNRIVEAVAELIGPECAARSITLEVDLDPEMPPVRVDAGQIQQAVLNIAKNAMEAVDKPEGQLALRTIVQGDHAILEIEDNGCGIPEEDRLAIFEPYHSTKFEGSGLGLMVVFNIVSAHKGAIGLDSEVGRGTVFRIALPLEEKPVRLLSGPPQ